MTHPDASATGPVQLEASANKGRLGLALVVIVAFQLMVTVDGTVMNVALPHIQRDLGFSTTNLAWVLNAYTLAFGGFLLLGGRTGDILGRRRVFLVGVAVFTVASLVGGFAPDAGWLLAARAVQGLGAAFGAPSTLALISSNFAEGDDRNRALGVFSTVAGLGLAVGLILGGVLTEFVSWRWVLFINVPIGIAVLVAAPVSVHEPERHPGRFDVSGAVVSTVALTSLVYGFIKAASGKWDDSLTIGGLVAGIALLAGFLVLEGRAAQPIIPLQLFRDRNRAGCYVVMLLLVAAMFSMFFFVIEFLQKGLDFSPLMAGVSFLPMALSLFLASRAAPVLIPRFGPKPLILTGAALLVTGLLWLTLVSVGATYPVNVLGPVVLMGVGAGTSFMPLNMMILSGLPPRDVGAASGTLQAMQQVGSSVGLAVLITAFGDVSRQAMAHPPAGVANLSQAALADGLRAAFALGAVLALCGLVVASVMITGRPRRQQP